MFKQLCFLASPCAVRVEAVLAKWMEVGCHWQPESDRYKELSKVNEGIGLKDVHALIGPANSEQGTASSTFTLSQHFSSLLKTRLQLPTGPGLLSRALDPSRAVPTFCSGLARPLTQDPDLNRTYTCYTAYDDNFSVKLMMVHAEKIKGSAGTTRGGGIITQSCDAVHCTGGRLEGPDLACDATFDALDWAGALWAGYALRVPTKPGVLFPLGTLCL
ncbi:hypothetical protein FIBSPDRAFT_900476 [Athelia psychrophila]|uniref:Uncharacterized protein n=1 Tax=Athelia psychrophila TaxID=1759441 RepID=A0A165YDY9_9AGAM|nr:hypothetical protein FIBSPDRAFT_900476 [Fibularhizoctonia sp. CBS 109695]